MPHVTKCEMTEEMNHAYLVIKLVLSDRTSGQLRVFCSDMTCMYKWTIGKQYHVVDERSSEPLPVFILSLVVTLTYLLKIFFF